VIDTHVHGRGFVPDLPWRAYRFVNRGTMPPDTGFDVLREAGVDAVVAKAVGDPLVTRLWRGDAWDAVVAQLDLVRADMASVGGEVVSDASGVRAARAAGRPAALLGVEGADVIGRDVDGIDRLFSMGVRVVGLVHFADNALGTICMPWQRFVAPLPSFGRRRRPGLTDVGAAVVARMNALGMVIDLAHADRQTILDVCGLSGRPVVSTHTGARALQDFARYLSDEEVQAIAATGGAVGLWPFCYRGKGAADVGEWGRHARHLVDLVGAEHVCIGTDMNGVPGLMDGYRGEADFPVLVQALEDAGLDDAQARQVLGESFLRVLESA